MTKIVKGIAIGAGAVLAIGATGTIVFLGGKKKAKHEITKSIEIIEMVYERHSDYVEGNKEATENIKELIPVLKECLEDKEWCTMQNLYTALETIRVEIDSIKKYILSSDRQYEWRQADDSEDR